VVKVIWQHAESPPHMGGSVVFARWHRCAPHLYMLPWAPKSNLKQHLDRFRRVCTVHGRESLYFTTGCPVPLKTAASHGGIWTSCNTWFLGPIRVHNPNGISIASAIFSQLTAECPYTLQWATPPPWKLPLPVGDLDPHVIRGSLGPPESSA